MKFWIKIPTILIGLLRFSAHKLWFFLFLEVGTFFYIRTLSKHVCKKNSYKCVLSIIICSLAYGLMFLCSLQFPKTRHLSASSQTSDSSFLIGCAWKNRRGLVIRVFSPTIGTVLRIWPLLASLWPLSLMTSKINVKFSKNFGFFSHTWCST